MNFPSYIEIEIWLTSASTIFDSVDSMQEEALLDLVGIPEEYLEWARAHFWIDLMKEGIYSKLKHSDDGYWYKK